MEISKAHPIKFWLNGQETFNEKRVPGIDRGHHYFQPFKPSDQIKLQITEEEVDCEYLLEVLDCNDTILDTLQFVKTEIEGVNVYTLEFDFASIDNYAGEGFYYLQIIRNEVNLTATVSGLLGTVSAEIDFSIPADDFDLQGTANGLLGTVGGNITTVYE